MPTIINDYLQSIFTGKKIKISKCLDMSTNKHYYNSQPNAKESGEHHVVEQTVGVIVRLEGMNESNTTMWVEIDGKQVKLVSHTDGLIEFVD